MLYENSAYGRLLSQLFPYFSAQALNISSKIWLVLSVCPSISGWYAELKLSLVSVYISYGAPQAHKIVNVALHREGRYLVLPAFICSCAPILKNYIKKFMKKLIKIWVDSSYHLLSTCKVLDLTNTYIRHNKKDKSVSKH